MKKIVTHVVAIVVILSTMAMISAECDSIMETIVIVIGTLM